jgi:phosphoribosylformylglycinamidine (FGAM) synthase PurS component
VKARVTVTLKSGVLDPQGQAIQCEKLLANTVIENYAIEIAG